MKTLHIVRSEPDQTTQILLEAVAGNDPETVKLYSNAVDWDKLIEDIFTADKVICWW